VAIGLLKAVFPIVVAVDVPAVAVTMAGAPIVESAILGPALLRAFPAC
jgi:hypothetical protein